VTRIREKTVVVAYLFQLANKTCKHNKFYKARQPERKMPIMLATYSTNKIIVLKVKEEEDNKH